MTKMQAEALHGGAMPSGWLNRPLCRHYVLGIFDAAAVRWRAADGWREHPVHWGIGCLPDGECDLLGAWVEPERSSGTPPRMFADLERRGVERMSHVIGASDGHLSERASTAFAGSTLGASVDPRLAEALAPSRRRGLPSPVRVAEQVRERLLRAIRRRGSFENESSVLDFLADALQRMEHRLDSGGPMATVGGRLDRGALMAPPGL
jgi:transposase-like protein